MFVFVQYNLLRSGRKNTLKKTLNIVLFKDFAKRDNLIFTPHIAGWSNQSYVRINEVLVKKIKEFIKVGL